jgi:homoserine/homoserine lactone efflux protein
LGIRLWRSSGIKLDTSAMSPKSHRIKFLEGLTLQLTNPKAVFFFLSIFPQFVDAKQAFVPQFALLVATYSCLVIVIHLCYASLAHHARDWFSSNRGAQMFNKLGGSIFVFFGLGLASSNK